MRKLLTLLVILQTVLLLSACAGATPNVPVKIKDIKPAAASQRTPKCLPAMEMESSLFASFKEIREATALMNIQKDPPEKLLVIFYVSKGGTWTTTITGKKGVSCIVLWGDTYTAQKMKEIDGIKI